MYDFLIADKEFKEEWLRDIMNYNVYETDILMVLIQTLNLIAL